MRRPEMKETQTLARLTFNTAAARQLFDESTKGIRLRIEHGVVGFRPSASLRGTDVIALERRPRRGVYVDIISGQESKKLMGRLFRAGLTEEEPYFSLEPQTRGWFGIDHVADQPDPRHPMMTVSEFEQPPPPVDLFAWRRFMRLLSNQKRVDADLWNLIRRMVRGAAQVTAKPHRGRVSQARLDAETLTKAAGKSGLQLRALSERQPEYDSDVTALLVDLGIEDEVAELTPRRRRSAPEPLPDEPETEALPDEPDPSMAAENEVPEEEELGFQVVEVVIPPRKRTRRTRTERQEVPAEDHSTQNEVFERGIDRLLDETEATQDTEHSEEAAGSEPLASSPEAEGGEPAGEPKSEAVLVVEEFFITEVPPTDDADLPPDPDTIIEDWGSEPVGTEQHVVGAPDQPETVEHTDPRASDPQPEVTGTTEEDDKAVGGEGAEGHHREHDETHPPHGLGDQPDIEEEE